VWPKDLGLDTFVTSTSAAPTILRRTVQSFMDGARSYYEGVQATIKADQSDFNAAVNELQNYLNTFKLKVANGVTR